MGAPGEEIFEVVDEDDRIVGRATRRQCHGNPSLIHRVAHVLVFNGKGELLLQKRSLRKDIQPCRWDTSVGGHLDPGEDYLQAALRETREELGIEAPALTFLYRSRLRNDVESENVGTFMLTHEGPFPFDPGEIEQVRFWAAEEIGAALGSGVFTPNFEEEWHLFQNWKEDKKGS
jgi:isopentenyldiphosphate isomerase